MSFKPCRLVEGWSMPSFMDQTFMAASARANCSATPVNKKPNMFFHFLQFFIFFCHHLIEGKSNQRFGFDSLSYCHRDYWTTPPQMKSNDKKQCPGRSSPATSSSLSRIKFIRLTHLQQSEPLWSRPSFGSRIVHPPADRPPYPPSLRFPCPRRHSNLQWCHPLHPSPSTQSGAPLSPGPLPLAWWYVPLLWPPDLNTEGNQDSDRLLEEKMIAEQATNSPI